MLLLSAKRCRADGRTLLEYRPSSRSVAHDRHVRGSRPMAYRAAAQPNCQRGVARSVCNAPLSKVDPGKFVEPGVRTQPLAAKKQKAHREGGLLAFGWETRIR